LANYSGTTKSKKKNRKLEKFSTRGSEMGDGKFTDTDEKDEELYKEAFVIIK
jgi:hypothetical protein